MSFSKILKVIDLQFLFGRQIVNNRCYSTLLHLFIVDHPPCTGNPHLGWAVAGSDLVSVSDTINWLLHQARQVTIHWPALHTSYKTKHQANSNNVMIEGY